MEANIQQDYLWTTSSGIKVTGEQGSDFRRHAASRQVPSFVDFNRNLFTLTQIAHFFFSKRTHSSGQLTG